MAQTFSAEMNGLLNAVPVTVPSGALVGGRVRRYRATITLTAQAIADTIVLAKVPAGKVFAFGILNATASLSTSTVAIGTAAAAGKYRAAAVFTATDTPTLFGVNAAMVALSDEETVILTVAALALPAAGTLIVDLYFSGV